MASKSVHSFALLSCLIETNVKRIVQYITIQFMDSNDWRAISQKMK